MLTKPPPKEFTKEMKKQKQDAGRIPGNEFEVTPEMIKAGLEAFFPFDRRYDEIDGAIARVWRAMWMARLEGQAVARNEAAVHR